MSEEIVRRLAENLEVGRFECGAGDAGVGTLGPTRRLAIVFPERPVRLSTRGGRFVVIDPTSALVLSPAALFSREILTPEGARCRWLGFPLTPRVDESPLGAATRGLDALPGLVPLPKTPALALLQRRFFREAERDDKSGRAAGEVEDLAAALVEELVGPSLPAPRGESRRADEIVEAAKGEILASPEPAVSPRKIADVLGVSVFHLCRVFRRRTGDTVLGFARRVRLEAALDRLRDPGCDLASLAAELGFSSHSHFSAAFRRRFGASPSALRGRRRRPGLSTR